MADIPFYPVQGLVLQLVWRCIIDCPGVISLPQIKEILLFLTKISRDYTEEEVGLQPATLILACSILADVLKLSSVMDMQEVAVTVQEASKNFILSSFSSPHEDSDQLMLYSLYLLKETHLYSLKHTNPANIILEKTIIETCEIYILPWLERAIDEGEEEEIVLDVLETFHLVLLRGSESETLKFAEVLISSSWFSLSFRCLGLFPSVDMKSRAYLLLSSVIDRAVGHEFGNPIRDAYLHLPSDPLELLFLLGQKSSYDYDLVSSQHAVILILYVSSLFGERYCINITFRTLIYDVIVSP